MQVAISGASGLVGRALAAALAADGHQAVPLVRGGGPGIAWDPAAGAIDGAALAACDAVVHLAGETVAQRWTTAARARIRDSRVRGTRLIAEALARAPGRARTLVCASAVGIYGDTGDRLVDERSPDGSGFLAGVCRAWEDAAAPARAAGLRVVHLRLGMVLAAHGGALARMLPAFRWGLGGRVGSGRQWLAWIALSDAVALARRALDDPALDGAVNAVAPEPVTQAAFATALGEALRRPAFMPLPATAVRLALGAMGQDLLLGSSRVLPGRLLAAGHRWQLPTVDRCLASLLHP